MSISSKARGKELCLYLKNAKGEIQTFCWSHGLVGKWRFTTKTDLPQYARLQFRGDHDFVLRFVAEKLV